MLDDETACVVVKKMLSKNKQKICFCKHATMGDFFNSCFIVCKEADSERKAFALARFAIGALVRGDTNANTKRSRNQNRTRELPERNENESEVLALRLDLTRAMLCLTESERVLFDLRFNNSLTQHQACDLLCLTRDQLLHREHKIVEKLRKALKDWK